MYQFTLIYDSKSTLVTNQEGDSSIVNLPATAQTLQLSTPPVGWDNLQLTYTRSDKYYSLLRTVTGELKFTKDGKDFIDNIVLLEGFNSVIQCIIDLWDANTMSYFTIMDGILDLKTYKREHFTTSCNIIDGQFQQSFLNRGNIDIKYQSTLLDINQLPYHVNDMFGNPVVEFGDEWETITLRPVASNPDGNPETQSAAIYPFNLFSRLINIMTGRSDALISDIFDQNHPVDSNGLIDNLAYHMITNGTYLRGFPYNQQLIQDQGDAGYINFASLSISFEKLFKSFDAMFNLGLGIEYTNGQPYIRIDYKNYFYQPNVILQIDTIADLIYIPDETFLYSKIEVGYSEFTNDNKYGMQEYINKTIYSTPLIPFDKTLNIISDIRADGTGIEQLRTNPAPSTPTQELRLDNKIYVVSCFRSSSFGNNLTSLQQEKVQVQGIYASNPVIFNNDIVQGQMLMNWGDIISIGLQNCQGSLIFQQSKRPVTITSQAGGSAPVIPENADIPLDDLDKPYLSGWKAQFNAPVGITEIKAIESNKNGLVRFYDYIAKDYKYGWIKEVSTNPVDKTTTWELQMMSDSMTGQIMTNGFWLAEDGSFCMAQDATFIVNEIQG